VDAFELIRREAERLHDVVVAEGADALDPYALVLAAGIHLDLEVYWLPIGDPTLKGGRALFDDQSGAILCEDVEDLIERAQLLAHEIGHSKLHTSGGSCSEHDIDPSRTTEAAPVGLERVEDYGARERRELQANVFGREFLFPRRFARELHIRNGQSASALAKRTGLPLTLIRQQLFDALLLPAWPEGNASQSQEAGGQRPDPGQERAVAHRDCAFQLQAGPGTGKTRTLIRRVSSLVAEGVDPTSILVLTFSNRAAGELSERLTKAIPEAAPRLWIGTFHAFGLDLVRRHYDRLRLSPQPSLFDRSDAIAVLEEILPTLPLRHYRNLWDPAMVLKDIISAISRAKDELVCATAYRQLAFQMLANATDEKSQVDAEKCLEIADIYDLYQQALARHGGVDFGDLIMRPALLLESDEEVRLTVQLRHRHVLVDEYQDVNRASARLLKALAGDGKRLWVVGDARQSIYRFRGASSTNMVQFGTDYPGASVDRLEVNYRSTEQIVDTVEAVAPHMGASQAMLPLELTADRGRGPARPQIRRFETLQDEAAGIAASILELQGQQVPLCKQAVLCRSNARLNDIAFELEARGIPVLHLGSLFERDEVRDLLGLLSLAVDPFADGLVRVGAMPRYQLSLQDVYAISRYLRTTPCEPMAGLTVALRDAEVSEAGRAGLARLVEDLTGLASRSSPWEFLSTYLLDRTDLALRWAQSTTITDKVRAVAVWQFLNFLRDQAPLASGRPIQRTLDRVRQLVLLAEERDLRQVPAAALHLNAVRLMTVHGSKGLEFEAVHIPGLTVTSFPSSYKPQRCPMPTGMIMYAVGSPTDEARRSQEDEEQCLFFVALSRARTHLSLYLSSRQPNGKARGPSRFLDWLPTALADTVPQPAQFALPASAPRPQPISIVWPSDWQLTDSRLGLYEKCPRRFFYTHVLRLGGARKPTAFSQTHGCLYHLLRWMSEQRKTGHPTIEQTEAAFETIWQEHGPTAHAFAQDYRQLASRLVAAFVASGAGRRFRNSEVLAIDLPNGRVIVEPSEIAELPDGSVVVRRVRTGHKRSDEYDRLEYTLYQLAAQARFGADVTVEALHLTDETTEGVSITATKVKNRQENAVKMLSGIASGQFDPDPDAVTCPRCPHFFACPALAAGALNLT
jgi:superfamily I DNA/RNA helicase/Zn-dependent peptidase ImmA (M78 family)